MIDISNKQNNQIFSIINGSNILNDIEFYNKVFGCKIQRKEDIRFFIFSDKSQKEISEKDVFYIIGINITEFLNVNLNLKYIYEVELKENSLYCRNTNGSFIFGSIKLIKKQYKLKFSSFKEYNKKEDTFFNLIDEIINYLPKDFKKNFLLEIYAINSGNFKLLKHIVNYKGKSKEVFDDKSCIYYDDKIDGLKDIFIKSIKFTNKYKQELVNELKEVNTIFKFLDFLNQNEDKIKDSSDYIYKKNDNISNTIPTNGIHGNFSLKFFDNDKFNSSLPFYFQYRNYKISTLLLKNIYSENLIKMETVRHNTASYRLSYYFGELRNKYDFFKKLKIKNKLKKLEKLEKENSNLNLEIYGLYFPLLMNFRQSVELSFKLIFVNEYIKKQNCTKKELSINLKNNYNNDKSIIFERGFNDKDLIIKKGFNTHNLLSLLSFIEEYIKDEEIYNFLYSLSSFIYFLEHEDASYSRYIMNTNFEMNTFTERVYYQDLIDYIDEFYKVMDALLQEYDFGFNIDEVFLKSK